MPADVVVGQVVYSKCGRDKGRPFIISAIEGAYLYLTDGEIRTVQKPKRKKIKHIQITHNIAQDIADKIIGRQYLNDSDFRKALVKYKL